MYAARAGSRSRQQGIATIIVVLFLVTAVIFALSQTLTISGSNSTDNMQQADSVAALFLAESGLEAATAIVTSQASGGTMTGSACTAINDGVTYALGRGTFKYVSAIPIPDASCAGFGCTGCNVQVTAKVASASRTLGLDINMTNDNGKSGFGTVITIKLKNTFNVPATAVFNLAWRRQGGTAGEVIVGGNAVATTSAGCTLRWNDESSSGSPSGGSLGASCDIGASPASVDVTQTIDNDRNYAIVGALFPGLTGAPVKIHSYWNDGAGGAGTKTVNNTAPSPSAGLTNSGVATSDLAPCVTPDPATTGTSQTCTSWCQGGDTLIFGVSARSTTFADEITAVTFNTNGTPSQNISMAPSRGERVAHFPNTDGAPPSTGDIYSEIWYAYNPDYLSTADAYSGWSTTGSIGVSSFNATVTNGSSVMLVNSLSGFLHVGDTVSCTSGGGACGFSATAIAVNGTPCGAGAVTCAATGNYTLVANSTVNRTRDFQTSSSFLDVSAIPSPAPSIGDTIISGASAGTTITSTASAPSYGISSAQQVSSTTIAANNATITVPTGTSIPTSDTMIVAVRNGAGLFSAQTTVLSSPAPTATSFTVSAVPATRLSGATICGGTCAFFDNPGSTSSTTEFQVTKSAGTDQWAGGFTCLSGVDKSKIQAIKSSTTSASTWRESIQ